MVTFKEIEQDIIDYVRRVLESSNSSGHPRKVKIGYSRFQHTLRVYKWMVILYDAYPEHASIDFDALAIATLFHDIGYCDEAHQREHAGISSHFCREYLQKIHYPMDRIDFICQIIAAHSDKKLLQEADIPVELVLLLEADLLDDTGAQAIVLDVWTNAVDATPSFDTFLAQMTRVSGRILSSCPMRTDKGREIWHRKQKLVEDFLAAYELDISTMRQ